MTTHNKFILSSAAALILPLCLLAAQNTQPQPAAPAAQQGPMPQPSGPQPAPAVAPATESNPTAAAPAPETPAPAAETAAPAPEAKPKPRKPAAKKPTKRKKAAKTPVAAAAKPAETTSAQISSEDTIGIMKKLDYGEVAGPDLKVYVPITGVSTAEDLVDVVAPIDGALSELNAKPGQWVRKDEVLGIIASKEMVALLNASSEVTRERTRKRWGQAYPHQLLRAPADGLIISVKAKEQAVYQGDRILTISCRSGLVATTDEKVYTELMPGITGTVLSQDQSRELQVTLRQAVQVGTEGKYQLQMDFVLPENAEGSVLPEARLMPGMKFKGSVLALEKTEVSIVPTKSLIEYEGNTYVLTLTKVKTGYKDNKITEVDDVYPGEVFIYPGSISKLFK